MDDTMVNGRKLKEIREARHLTQKELGARAKVSQAHISRYEGGQRTNAEVGTIGRLAEALGVLSSELLIESHPVEDLPPLRVYLQRKYGVDTATADQLAHITETLITSWRPGQAKDPPRRPKRIVDGSDSYPDAD